MRWRLPFLVVLALVAAPAALPFRNVGASVSDLCIDPSAEDPTHVVDVTHSCDSIQVKVGAGQASATLVYERTESGGFILRVIVEYAHETKEFVLECAKPGGFVPTYPVRTYDYDCAVVDDAWTR